MSSAECNRLGVYVPSFLPDTSKFSETVLPILSSILTDLCKTNDRCQPADRSQMKITKFHAAQVPPISIESYLKRIAQYSEASDTCYILALVYLDRIQARPEFLVTSLNIHRLLITSVMVAAKFFDDHYYNNAFYARIGGIAKEEMNSLELEFLFMIGFSLSVSHPEFVQYDSELRAHYARRQAAASGQPSAAAVVPAALPMASAARPPLASHASQHQQQHQQQQQPAVPMQQQQQQQQPQPQLNGSRPQPVMRPSYAPPSSAPVVCASHMPQQRGASNARATFSYPHTSFYDAKDSYAPFGASGAADMQVEHSPKFNAHAHAHAHAHSHVHAHGMAPSTHGIAIRQPAKSRAVAGSAAAAAGSSNAPNCSPPVSDFPDSVHAPHQWVMIK